MKLRTQQKLQFHHGGFRRRLRFFTNSFVKSCQDTFGYLFSYRSSERINAIERNYALVEALGRAMTDPPGNANRDNSIPSGYTYLGQFIDHDITRDAMSELKKVQSAIEIMNLRTPCLDLDSLYGDGPAAHPHLYDRNDPIKFLMGENGSPIPGGAANPDFDLPRNSQGIAIIGDPRNDENLLVAQTHLTFLRFHNAVVDHLRMEDPSLDDGEVFESARLTVIRHYQWLVVHDFLKTIADEKTIDKVFRNGPRYFKRKFLRRLQIYMPVEFSVAAYRFGHSMIRNVYDHNQFFPNANFNLLFRFTKNPVPGNWVIDWNRFFKIKSNVSPNLARKIDTKVALEMEGLPGEPSGSLMAILSARNMVRGVTLKLPTGQAVARRMNIPCLTAAQLKINASASEIAALEAQGDFLLEKTPLWYYILKEAEVKEKGKHLGKLGSTIIGEVFFGMLDADPESFLNAAKWKPTLPSKKKGDFTMVDLIQFAKMDQIQGIN